MTTFYSILFAEQREAYMTDTDKLIAEDAADRQRWAAERDHALLNGLLLMRDGEIDG